MGLTLQGWSQRRDLRGRPQPLSRPQFPQQPMQSCAGGSFGVLPARTRYRVRAGWRHGGADGGLSAWLLLPACSLGVLAGIWEPPPAGIPESARPPCLCPCWLPADFVLVWEEDLKPGQQQDTTTRDKTDMHGDWRETFLDNLRAAGLCVDQVRGVGCGQGPRRCIHSVTYDLAPQGLRARCPEPWNKSSPRVLPDGTPAGSSRWLQDH